MSATSLRRPYFSTHGGPTHQMEKEQLHSKVGKEDVKRIPKEEETNGSLY